MSWRPFRSPTAGTKWDALRNGITSYRYLPNTLARSLKSQWRPFAAAIVGAALTILLIMLGQLARESGRIRIDVDLLVAPENAISTVHANLFVNSLHPPPQQITFRAGLRETLTFEVFTQQINLLRLDPNNVPAKVTIYGITIKRGADTVRHFGPAELMRFQTEFVPTPQLGDGFTYLATNSSTLQWTEPIQLKNPVPEFVLQLLPANSDQAIFWYGVKAAIIATVLALLFGGQFVATAAALGSMAIVWLTLHLAHAVWLAPPPSDKAVGFAAFHGLSVSANAWGLILGLIGTVIYSYAIAWCIPRQSHFFAVVPATVSGDARKPKPSGPIIAAGVMIVVVLLWGDLRFHLMHLTDQKFGTDWDSQQVVVWDYLSHIGKLPFKDFWYPYGGRYMMQWPAPFGFLAQNIYSAIVYSSLFFVIYSVTRFGALVALSLTLWFIWGEAIGAFWQSSRYLLAPLIALSMVTVDWSERRIQWGHLFFNILCCTAVVTEATQLIYASVGCAAILSVYLLSRRFSLQNWIFHFVSLFALPTVTLFALLIDYAATGRLSNAIDFYGGFGDQSAYSAIPADLLSTYATPSDVGFIVFAAPFVLAAFGLTDLFRSLVQKKNGPIPPVANAVLVCGVVGWMLLFKHVLRTMDWQITIISALGLVFIVARCRALATPLVHYLYGGVVAVAAAVFVLTGGILWVNGAIQSRPVLLKDFLNGLYFDRQQLKQVNALAFGPTQFILSDDESRIVEYIQKHRDDSNKIAFYSLSDNPVLYLLLRQSTPYFLTAYNESPIYEQEKNAEWIRTNRPEFMIFDPRQRAFGGPPITFDGVPNPIRLPLIFEEAAMNYGFYDRVGRFDILRRLRSGEVPDLSYWYAALGADIELGYLPKVSSFPNLKQCEKIQQQDCKAFLVLSLRQNASEGRKVTVTLAAGDFRYYLHFTTSKSVDKYYLPLGRMWFSEALKRNGLPIKIESINGLDSFEAQIEQREVPSNILY